MTSCHLRHILKNVILFYQLAKTTVSEDIKINCDNGTQIHQENNGKETHLIENSRRQSSFAVKQIRCQLSSNNTLVASVIER